MIAADENGNLFFGKRMVPDDTAKEVDSKQFARIEMEVAIAAKIVMYFRGTVAFLETAKGISELEIKGKIHRATIRMRASLKVICEEELTQVDLISLGNYGNQARNCG